MKRSISITFITIAILTVCIVMNPLRVFADEKEEVVSGRTYDLGEKDAYELNIAQEVTDPATRFIVKGDITNVSTNNGFVSYAVREGNLKILLNTQFGNTLFNQPDNKQWHIITDKTKVVDSTKLSQNIGSGAIVVQTSKDGKTWINASTETDIHNKMDAINNRTINGDAIQAFFETTNVQLTNGCYYRIIVAYKLQHEIDPSKILFVTKKNTEEKERIEVYQFYAYDPSVNKTETLNTKTAYEFGDVYRVDSQDGFDNPERRKSDDPHIDWDVGKFYVSGYTDYVMDGDIPVFLKVPGDRAALWFNLEQEIDKCNGRTDVKINYIDSGSDIYFGTPTIDNFGRGALIVRKSVKNNQKERQIYTNYLEASATVGANTRVDLFEEGDYEVALDYQLHYDKPFVFGTTTTKTLTYRIFFEFKVRNGDISLFLRDVDTNQFINNANVAEHGFYIDVANSQYLTMTIKREVLSDSMNGLVEDTKFSAVATEGREYRDEGIYTVTVHNNATNDDVVKRVYVGNRDILLAHMKTGIPISEINEKLAAGAHIDDNGQIIEPEPVVEEPEPEEIETVEAPEPEKEEVKEEEVKVEATPTPETINDETTVASDDVVDGENIQDQEKKGPNIFVVVSIFVVLGVAGIVAYKKKLFKTTDNTNAMKKGDEEK